MRAIKWIIVLLLLLTVLLLCKRFLFFNPNFAKEDIDEIVLLKVEHPYLGEVLERKQLEAGKLPGLYSELQWAIANGPAKLYTCFVIQIKNHSGETMVLRTNGQFFAPIRDDYFFKVQGSENLITKYWGIKPDCQSATANPK